MLLLLAVSQLGIFGFEYLISGLKLFDVLIIRVPPLAEKVLMPARVLNFQGCPQG